jgi:CRISPR-associated protein Cst2
MKNAIGFVLIDAPHSALNNAGSDVGERTENTIAVKVIRRGRDVFPYVSAQAWRRWWRDALVEKFKWEMSPIERKEKIAFTKANPFTYPDDDVFGYMRAQSAKEGGTLTRLSPLKTSPLVAVLPQLPTQDFGVMARHDGDPVPHEHQFYSVVLKGIFSLDLSRLGAFGSAARTGYKNLDKAYTDQPTMQAAIEDAGATMENGDWTLPAATRVQRARDAISALPFLSGGAKQALHHTDVTPKFVVFVVIEGGNNLFMNIAAPDENKLVNVAALREVLSDYSDVIVGDVYIGRQEGFLDGLRGELEALQDGLKESTTVHLLSPKRAAEEFAASLEQHFA